MNPKKTTAVLLCSFLAGCSVLTSCEYRRISLPKTGQAECYDEFGHPGVDCTSTWQDGMHQAGIDWPEPRFTLTYCDHDGPCSDPSADCDGDPATDVILDNLTGLMWERTSWSPDYVYLAVALAVIQANNEEPGYGICGYQDWRLPNVSEMNSLVHYGYAEENCNGAPCGTPADWLSSQGFIVGPYLHLSGTFSDNYMMTVDLATGDRKSGGFNTGGYHYLPVRGGSTGEPDEAFPANVWVTGENHCLNPELFDPVEIPCAGTGQDGDLQAGVEWPVPRFLPQNDGTVADVLTDLRWLPDANCGAAMAYSGYLTWEQAQDFIEQLNAGQLPECNDAYDDWRLPNVIELATLLDYGRDGYQVVDIDFFENIISGPYWTSTVFGPDPTSNLTIKFHSGVIEAYSRVVDSSEAHIWPVRSGE